SERQQFTAVAQRERTVPKTGDGCGEPEASVNAVDDRAVQRRKQKDASVRRGYQHRAGDERRRVNALGRRIPAPDLFAGLRIQSPQSGGAGARDDDATLWVAQSLGVRVRRLLPERYVRDTANGGVCPE